MMVSPEAKELIECSFDFAQPSLTQGCRRFEATIAPALAASPARTDTARLAHLLASAARGFKQTATTTAEIRSLIEDLVALSLAS